MNMECYKCRFYIHNYNTVFNMHIVNKDVNMNMKC